tara:strand:- start:1149 stop:1613 length:465 start_codon:yes stop_codon:yes gene_type:complete
MPFQPLPDKGPGKPNSSDFGLFIVRSISAAAFVYYQLLDQLSLARLFVWDKAEWDLANQLNELGLPVPGVLSVALIILLLIAFLGIVVGIFTRINALILLFLTAFIFIVPLNLSPTLTPQTLVLYLALFLGLAFGGAGRVSLDFLMAGKRIKTK